MASTDQNLFILNARYMSGLDGVMRETKNKERRVCENGSLLRKLLLPFDKLQGAGAAGASVCTIDSGGLVS